MPGTDKLETAAKMEGHIAYISVGSNIGDKLQNCQKGISALKQPRVSKLRAQSTFYLSEPVDYKEQEWFINAVVKIETTLKPFPLLPPVNPLA
jgi:2-amino-4-hydroxy-6-hydroxymethyldihydropteridine diphosphokinase